MEGLLEMQKSGKGGEGFPGGASGKEPACQCRTLIFLKNLY